MKRKTAQRLMYDRHQVHAEYIDTFGRPTTMPTGFWRTLFEILASAALIGLVVGMVLTLFTGHPHVHPH